MRDSAVSAASRYTPAGIAIVKTFAKVDSPRGLVWDGDRLYVMHPPHLSVFFDRDGDGVAEEQKILVKNCGWALKDRPADHASNGVTLGIDGYLYLAIGDFGAPLRRVAADQVVRVTGLHFQTDRLRVRVGSDNPHADDVAVFACGSIYSEFRKPARR